MTVTPPVFPFGAAQARHMTSLQSRDGCEALSNKSVDRRKSCSINIITIIITIIVIFIFMVIDLMSHTIAMCI